MNRPLARTISSIALLPLAFCGCDSGSDATNDDPTILDLAKSSLTRDLAPQVSAADSATLASDNQAFAIDAYRKLAAERDNLVFSPASISIALAMTYAGAVGTTASEMAAAMHFSLPPDRLHPAFDALDLALSARGEGKLGADGGPMRLHVVNAAWAERTYTFKSEYLDVLGTNYGAGINLLDFINGFEPSRVTINDWVAEKTEQRIKDLLPEGSITTLTRLVLTNAVYFNAAWLRPFDALNTHDSTFTALDGSSVPAKIMGEEFSSIPAVQTTGYTAFALPYQDERLSMLFVVPDAGTFTSFEASLDTAKLDGIVTSLVEQQVALSMPRFRIESSAELGKMMQQLGMQAAFQPGVADFSGMDGTQYLYISNILHKAFIDVAEKGTEAAAATAVVLSGRGMPSGLIINVNRPFLYVLRDQPTGAILFMGRVVDPSK